MRGVPTQFAICNLQFAICHGPPIRAQSPTDRSAAHSPRPAFTLLELTLVLALLVVIAALVWPSLNKPFAVERLRKSADKVRTEWVRTRIKAMTSGVPHVFRFQAETGNFQVEVYGGLDADVEAASASAFAAPQQAITPESLPEQGSPGVVTAVETGLPEGVVFAASESALDARSAGVVGQSAGSTDGWSQPLFFYPDGTASNARLLLRNENMLYMLLELRGLTGIAKVSDVLTADEVQ